MAFKMASRAVAIALVLSLLADSFVSAMEYAHPNPEAFTVRSLENALGVFSVSNPKGQPRFGEPLRFLSGLKLEDPEAAEIKQLLKIAAVNFLNKGLKAESLAQAESH